MALFRRLPIVVDAVQWFKLGDHKLVVQRAPWADGPCRDCGELLSNHGVLCIGSERKLVCPGDWISTRPDGTVSVHKPKSFAADFEALDVDVHAHPDSLPVEDPDPESWNWPNGERL
jgi:hypothetical protein